MYFGIYIYFLCEETNFKIFYFYFDAPSKMPIVLSVAKILSFSVLVVARVVKSLKAKMAQPLQAVVGSHRYEIDANG